MKASQGISPERGDAATCELFCHCRNDGGRLHLSGPKELAAAVMATFFSGVSSSSLCCGRRWVGRHGGIVGQTMVILDVEER